MAFKLSLLLAFFAALASLSAAELTCPSGKMGLCCMAVSGDTAGRCTSGSGCGSNFACCSYVGPSPYYTGYGCVPPIDSNAPKTTSTSTIRTSTTTVVTSTSQTFTSTASPSAPPIPSNAPLAEGWATDVACAYDPATRAFTTPDLNRPSNNTPKVCTALCADRGYVLAGVEYGAECLCANSYVDSAGPLAASASECKMACPGDASLTCGAGRKMQTYKFTGTLPALKLPAGWKQLSACAEDTSDRVFIDAVDTSTYPVSNTPATCAAACAARGFTKAGVEYGWECWCGNTLRSTVLTERPSTDCAYACPDSPGVTCGGPFTIQLYGLSN